MRSSPHRLEFEAYSKTQATIAKTKLGSELYGIVRARCESSELITLLEDMGAEGPARLPMNASAAQGVMDQQGISKMNHLDVNV